MTELRDRAPAVTAGELVSCRYCGEPLVVTESAAITCDVCHKLNAKQGAIPWSEGERRHVQVALFQAFTSPSDPTPREIRRAGRLPQPRRVTLERADRTVRLRFRDWRRNDLGRTVTAALMLAFAGVWFAGKLQGLPGYEGTVFGMALFSAALIAVSWHPLGRLMTPVTLTAGSTGLEVSSGLFGRKKQLVDRAQLRQFYCELRTIPATEDDAAEERFHLVARLRDGTTLELADLSQAEDALYLEGELERALDIVDRPVHGT